MSDFVIICCTIISTTFLYRIIKILELILFELVKIEFHTDKTWKNIMINRSIDTALNKFDQIDNKFKDN